ncbi:hypothetical protein [Kitasatospora sp. NPDC056531]|uniref:hypothetical protein n=1 Tax=Kitasatospora sp. NPDC056531 TaxID=3345856 RepID=UPI00369BAD72
MATSDGFGRQALRYLESAKNLVGCAGGAVGLGLHFAGLGGAWWPGVVAGLYGVGALLTPGPPPPGPTRQPDPPEKPEKSEKPMESEKPKESEESEKPEELRVVPPKPSVPPRPTGRVPVPQPELEALAAYLGTVPLPATAGVDALLAALCETGPGPVAERIVAHRLPVAVDGYLRAQTWLPWAGPDAPDPAAELAREVKQLSSELD